MNDGASEGRIAFEVDGTTLTVRDVIEGVEMRFRVDREPDLSPALPAIFPLPVDRAVSFKATSVSVAEYSAVSVRDGDGKFLARPEEPTQFPRGDYCLEVNGVTKAFIRVEDAAVSVNGTAGADPIEFVFDRRRTVSVGGRSLHTRPEATITVPDDPEALAEAVSVFGSSIREFSSERSWPTLRGHPPRIQRGDALDIPSQLTVPDSGVEVVVRPTYADVYRLSTLTYYLGARMRIGDRPAIRLANGYTERLPGEGPKLERRVEALFRTWFLLDTLVRTDGYVISDREEYDRVGPKIPFYPPNLEDLSMSERLMEYLEVDPETVTPHAPAWATEAVVRPDPAAAELLPHLAHVLAPVRVRGPGDRSRPDVPVGLTAPDRSIPGSRVADSGSDWVPNLDADPIPTGSSVALPAAYEHELRRPSPDPGEATVVFLVRSEERARRVRESLDEPAVPKGIDSISVVGSPTTTVVADALSDDSIDLLYCDLPIADGAPTAAGEPVDVPVPTKSDGPASPAVSVFEGSRDVAVAAAAIDRGGTGSAVLDGHLSPDRIRPLVELLVSEGVPLDTSLGVTPLSDRPSVRFAGNAATNVVSPNPPSPQLLFFESVSESEHRVTWRTLLCPPSWIGAEYQIVLDEFDHKKRLLGNDPTEKPIMSSEAVVDVSNELDSVLFLNDAFVSPIEPLTVERVEASARRALSANGSSESGSTGSARPDAEPECRD